MRRGPRTAMGEGRRKRGKSGAKLEVIRLEDLAPRAEVKGGAGKVLFGERIESAAAEPAAPPPDRGVSRLEGDERAHGEGGS